MYDSIFLRRFLALMTIISWVITSFALPLNVSASPKAIVDPRVLEQLGSQESITFWVILREKADLTPAYSMQNWDARGQFVYHRLQTVANSSQVALRSLLRRRAVTYHPFWIANAIRITAGKSTLQELQARPEVKQIIADGAYKIPEPVSGRDQAAMRAVEWNIDRIGAPQVWSTFGVRGEGIVIANIDTGVEFTHPALVNQYRGNLGGGTFDHNYNWFDPSQICGSPSLAPCDNSGHGTHTMGTMVGKDGNLGANQIGVAPGARWMAAKGCESDSCSFSALLASGEWILAPTNLNGQNPRPDLRPHIVNNSWGGPGNDPFYQAIVDAWNASGIYPQFSNGNSGPFCDTSSSPGDYSQSYSAGAFDINNTIADFSSRGVSPFGEIKPNISAPGVDVRSSVPGGYASFSGTSMASPHVAGTVALLWSAAPSLIGDIVGTRALLDQTAIDVSDPTCGGSAADNNVWGEGRLDAFTAVNLSPRGALGTLQGVVIDASTNLPISDVMINAQGPSSRTTFTDASGNYSLPLPVGSYAVSIAVFGFNSQTVSGIGISEGITTIQDFTLVPQPTHPVSGTVRNEFGDAVVGAVVNILATPFASVMTDANGFYSFASVPEGGYDVNAEAGGCNESQMQHLVVNGNETLDFNLLQHSDSFGYSCQNVPFNYIEANTDLLLFGDDAALDVSLPFPFPFYGQIYDTAFITTNGNLNFLSPNPFFINGPIPSDFEPNAAIYPFWDDLVVNFDSSIRTELLGSAPNRQFVIEWRNVHFCCVSLETVDFEVVLFEDGDILTQYRNIDANAQEQGISATVGIENETGLVGLQYSFDRPEISEGLAVRYLMPPSGFVEGVVNDANDGLPLSGVSIQAFQNGSPVRKTLTDENGFYRLMLPAGRYKLEASLANYATKSARIRIVLDQTVTKNFRLDSAHAVITPEAFDFVLPAGQKQTKTLTLRNTGEVALTFSIAELNVASLEAAGLNPPGVNTQTIPRDYRPRTAASVQSGGPVLVFMDIFPWDRDSLLQVLNANGIPFDIADSSQMGTIDMSQYEVVFISSDQTQDFYNNYNANFTAFEDYVLTGGFLWVGAAAWGFNGGDFNGSLLPGGATVIGPVIEEFNDIVDPSHPTMQGVPNPFFGTFASHAAFENLPIGANIIARAQNSGLPTLIEYTFGAGQVLAFGQTLEFHLGIGDPGLILENGVPYAYAFEPNIDIPWLSEIPDNGTLTDEGKRKIRVTVDATGLTPGLYRARLVIRTNDPKNARIQVPVTLLVSEYSQGVNAGGEAYTDLSGNKWAADRKYTAGKWGYVGESSTMRTERTIAGTDDDRLYRDLRQRVSEYRFDNLTPGTYEVDLRFAELRNIQPGKRRFDVVIEGQVVLPAHDIASELGKFTADNHTFYIYVSDGQLNINFIAYDDDRPPIINALRVTHRPDL